MNTTTDDSVLYNAEKSDPRKKISWASIWAGALIGIVLLILLNLLGLGVGFSTLDIAEERNPAKGLGIGAGIWYLVSSLIALFVAGWVAGRLAQTRRIFDGALHGILTWCVVTLVSIYFLTTTIGSIIGGVGNLIGGTVKTVGSASGTVIEAVAPNISNQIGDIDLSELQNEGTSEEVIEMFREANGDPAQVDRNKLADVIMSASDRDRAEATRNADSLISKYETMSAKWQETKGDIREGAVQTADKAADVASTTFIVAFFAFIVGALAAGFGAKFGTESKDNPYFERTQTNVRTSR